MRAFVSLLLGGVLMAFVGYFWMAQPESLPERYILSADRILTLASDPPYAQAVLVSEGEIAAVGDAEALAAQFDVPVVHRSAVITPGLVEPHTHPIAAALLGATLDVSAFSHTGRESIMAALEEAAGKRAITPWIVAFGWDPVAFPGMLPPTLEELDAIAPDRPMLILSQMLHDAYINTAAKEAAGVQIAGNHLHETAAVNSVVSKIPSASSAVVELLVRRQFAKYAQAGFTTIGVTGAVGRHDDPVGLLQTLSTEPRSVLRSFVYLLQDQHGEHPFGGNMDFAVLGVKLWLDGSPFTGGAATASPYARTQLVNSFLGIPAGQKAPVMMGKADFVDLALPLQQVGAQLALHVQGERAVDRALDGITELQTRHPQPGLHHRLEHNALITKVQIERAVALGVSLSFFVDHVTYYGHVLPLLFGVPRAERYMPMADALAAGASVSLHGDHPATPIDPTQTLRTAVTRQGLHGDGPTGIAQAISKEAALAAMTREAAWQLRQGDTLGTISVGKQADFTLWSADPLEDGAMSAEVLGTIKAGQPVDTRMISWLKPRLVWQALREML
ncbi:amidohydrolase [Shimia sp. NS0008-38b]|uniref:amidohydrolase n=1 Tax=Shimia sp. NS0008-38b TaxID=3127653 RepID=UPI003105D3EE